MKIQSLKEVLVPRLEIYSNVTINLMQVKKLCYEIIIILCWYSTVYLLYFVPYFSRGRSRINSWPLFLTEAV